MFKRMTLPPWAFRHRRALGLLAIVFPPLIPLLLHREFYGDWFYHQWAARYCAAYFLEHLGFPFTFDVLDAVGQADPLFYGRFYYPVAGVLTAAVGYFTAIRLLVAASLLLIGWTTLRFAERHVGEPFAWVIAASAVWETYSLTNLYYRYALPEFFAQAALRGALPLLAGFLDSGGRPFRERAALLAGGFFCWNAAIGTHPITGLYGTAVLIPALGAYALMFHARELPRTLLWIVLPALASFALHIPFLRTYREFGSDLGVRDTMIGLLYAPGIDHPLVRLSPLPLDIRVLTQPFAELRAATPFLNAQFNWSLAIAIGLLAAQAWRRKASRGRLAAIVTGVTAAAGFFFAVSVWPAFSAAFSPAFDFAQFAYRFVAMVNLVLLAGVLLVLRASGTSGSAGPAEQAGVAGWRTAFGLAAAVLAVQASVITVAPYVFPSNPDRAVQVRDLTHRPWGAVAYTTPARFSAAPPASGIEVRTLVFPPRPSPDARYSADVLCKGPCQILTNVSAFAGNRLACGADAGAGFAYTPPHGPDRAPWILLGCVLKSGGGTVAYELQLPPALRWAIPASVWLFFAWGGVWLALAIRPWRKPPPA